MKLSQRIRYGVACLVELSRDSAAFTDANHVARQQKIPTAYAHKILQQLAQAGLVFSMKGAGYKLARPLSYITALDLFDALAQDEPRDSFPSAGNLLEQRINTSLSSLSLGDL